jgi:hypothetical protein
MRIAKHICFFYLENRFIYLNQLIKAANNYNYKTDIFIHTNRIFDSKLLDFYSNGDINIIVHDLSNIHPYFLPWKCRPLMKDQRDDYDIFMYIEDDILVRNEAIEYWLQYKDVLLENNCNLGFLRVENHNNLETLTDIFEKFNNRTIINNQEYVINDKNNYCAFWIYDKSEFNKFINSIFYDIDDTYNGVYLDLKNRYGFYPREACAIGLHAKEMSWYKTTLIPILNNELHSSCKIYHLPNNYPKNNYLFTNAI